MGQEIRVRACLAAINEDKLLLVPHYQVDGANVQWNIPGGKVEFGESVQVAARREFFEETGLEASITELLDISEVILPEKPWHSITITFAGHILGGRLTAESNQFYGEKVPRWFSAQEIVTIRYHPPSTVEKALAILTSKHESRRKE